MFGSRTTVKKVRNSLTWFSHQLEEAYARATVAITRARALTLPYHGPTRYEGPPWSCYGDGHAHVWSRARGAGCAHFYLHDHELSRSPPDESFIDMLKQNCCLSGPHFPPPAIVEVLHAGLCHQLLQGTATASHCGGLVAAMEVQYCRGQRNH